MGQTRRKKACKTPPSTPKDPRETPKTTNHDGTVALSGRPWPRTKDPKGAPKTPLGHRGGRQNSAKQKLRAPLQKTQKKQKRATQTYPKSDRHLRGFGAHALRGAAPPLQRAFFADAAARRKHKNHHFTAVLDPKGCQNARKPCILRGFVNTRLSRRRHSAQISVVICGLVLHWAPARTRKTRPKIGLKVVVTLVRLWGPRSSPRGCPERAKSPRRTAKHDKQLGFSKNY